MLVITRKPEERIALFDSRGDLLGHIKVVSIRGDRVRLGMELPKSIQIFREEIVLGGIDLLVGLEVSK